MLHLRILLGMSHQLVRALLVLAIAFASLFLVFPISWSWFFLLICHHSVPIFLQVLDSIGHIVVCHTTSKGRPSIMLLTRNHVFKLLLKRKWTKWGCWFTFPEFNRSKNFVSSGYTTSHP